ncbi:Hint domain-containing protein [Marinibacterium sp. SX1]|uniref:Hint domain-containing protein n=1 Tax=Marinibacterium sp. SX1 TaxID=3388424 RepID=UPI003D1846C4
MNIAPVQSILVYPALCFRVSLGANMGDPVSFLAELTLDDVYELSPGSERVRLALNALSDGSFSVARSSAVGTPGARLHLDCTLLLMSPDGETTDALVLVEVDDGGHVDQIFLLPLAPLATHTGYTLIGAGREDVLAKFAQIACVSFTRGTHITMATGRQVPIEDIRPGDRVLTRDFGAQEVRWIGQTTVRAVGDFAPIVVTKGTLNNENDLVVSPDHRLFIYQRTDRIGAGRADLLVPARHLVNDDSIYVRTGGFVDYYQILFDRHHIIYAEGIAAESTLINPRTRPALPGELVEKLQAMLPRNDDRAEHGLDVQKSLLDRPDAIELLRRASTR